MRNDQQRENIFANQTSDKALLSKLYMKCKGFCSKKTNNPI